MGGGFIQMRLDKGVVILEMVWMMNWLEKIYPFKCFSESVFLLVFRVKQRNNLLLTSPPIALTKIMPGDSGSPQCRMK
jgi:hypothetical protein